MKPFCILGATGTTGKTIASILDAKNIPLVLAARNLEGLEKLANSLNNQPINKKIDIFDDYSIKEALSGAGLVINCIGPFTKYGAPVIEQALAQNIDYLDITGEQHYIHKVQQNYHQRAKDCNISIVPSSAFEFALGDSAIAMLAEQYEQLNSVDITYNFKNITTSRGTKNSVICALASPAFLRLKDKLVRIEPGAFVESIDPKMFKLSKCSSRFGFPGGEVFMAPLHTQVSTVKTFLASPSTPIVMAITSRTAMNLIKAPFLKEGLVHKLIDKTEQAIDETSQTKTFFEILVEAKGIKDKEEANQLLRITGCNPYRITAALVVALAQSLTDPKIESPSGVISPSMVAGYSRVVKTLELYGTKWQLSES